MIAGHWDKDRERSFSKGLETEARNCKPRGAKRAKCPRWVVWMKNVRKIRGHRVMTETLETKGSNFVFDPGFNWKPVESSEQ